MHDPTCLIRPNGVYFAQNPNDPMPLDCSKCVWSCL